ncbi:MAG: hypothetical protein K2G27_00390 [Duncaniella sp.]|nr:hypothetical protein [Duncaniella sp.]
MNISVLVADWNPNGNGGRGEIRASMPDSVRFNNLLLAKVNMVDAGLNEYKQKFPGQVNEGKRHKIPLTEPALRILRKWQAMGRRKEYVFDLVKNELSFSISS